MPKNKFPDIDTSEIETPCFILDEGMIRSDMRIIKEISDKAGVKVLLALKGFASYETFPLMKDTLAGICAGSLNEARLGREEFGKEVHTYCPAFKNSEFDEILSYSDFIIFNSTSQANAFIPKIRKNGKKVEIGLRLNPEKSVAGQLFGAYDPCGENSRLGIKKERLSGMNLEDITGLHFHALCEQGAEELEIVLDEFDRKFEKYIRGVSWVNFGGGHHFTKEGYNLEKLYKMINNFKTKYPNIQRVYFEPSEAIVLNSGVLVASVLDIVHNEKDIAIIDSSVESHFPDVLITRHEPSPYIQEILGAEIIREGQTAKHGFNYTLGGVSCAAGDVFGDYTFPHPLNVGDKLIFTDVAHYTIVKTSTFCGVNVPPIKLRKMDGELVILKEFDYEDYKSRL
ncbi:carboxynorspermidine decarboxylase [Candidatus Pacearchaeota archaeon CG10_big_fil_rev_8_21_14_0_10_32_14]|nr:MAG: carboxynorspermidine decarboxylase [Candidatus Pacearchaeota archaeon CG10_big_fil_rev_8_21_14_0_10_32_14]